MGARRPSVGDQTTMLVRGAGASTRIVIHRHATRVGNTGLARTSSPSSPYLESRDDAVDRKLCPASFEYTGVPRSLPARGREMDFRS